MRKVAIAFVLTSSLCLTTVHADAPLPRFGVFVYSNQCVSAGSGDIYGDQIILIRQAGFDEVIWQNESSEPVIAFGPMVKIYNDTSMYRVDAADIANPGKSVILTGTLSAEKLTLSIRWNSDGSSSPNTLIRIQDLSKKPGNCRSSSKQ